MGPFNAAPTEVVSQALPIASEPESLTLEARRSQYPSIRFSALGVVVVIIIVVVVVVVVVIIVVVVVVVVVGTRSRSRGRNRRSRRRRKFYGQQEITRHFSTGFLLVEGFPKASCTHVIYTYRPYRGSYIGTLGAFKYVLSTIWAYGHM